MQIISATELARNTREILDCVAIRGETVQIERNQAPIAQIMPAQKTMTAAQALDGLLLPSLTPLQADNWLKDARQGYEETVRDPWA